MNPKEAKKWFGVTPPDLSVECARVVQIGFIPICVVSIEMKHAQLAGITLCLILQCCMPHVLYEYQGEQVKNHETGMTAACESPVR
jgi:ubiquinol-cytochrome c reductase cytochrome c1 subunit